MPAGSTTARASSTSSRRSRGSCPTERGRCGCSLAGHFWYDTRPNSELGPEVTLTLVGNRDIPDRGLDNAAREAFAAALDDLRALGELDLQLVKSER